MFSQEALDLGGIDVEAANDEHVLLAADDAQPAGVGELAEVAGVQPAVGVDRVGSRQWIVEVPLHHAVAAHQHFSVVGDTNLDSWTLDFAALGAEVPRTQQYLRAGPKLWAPAAQRKAS